MVDITIVNGGIWANLITTEPCSPEPWNHSLDMGESSPNGRKIQASKKT